jgi:hypothetical protein
MRTFGIVFTCDSSTSLSFVYYDASSCVPQNSISLGVGDWEDLGSRQTGKKLVRPPSQKTSLACSFISVISAMWGSYVGLGHDLSGRTLAWQVLSLKPQYCQTNSIYLMLTSYEKKAFKVKYFRDTELKKCGQIYLLENLCTMNFQNRIYSTPHTNIHYIHYTLCFGLENWNI